MASPPPPLPPKTKTIYLLTGDIGGTNSRMGLYDATTNQPLQVKYYPNDQVMTTKTDGIFEQNVIAPFLKHCWTVNDNNNPPLAVLDEVEIVACFAIAGPVRHNRVSMSNLHFIEIDGDKIANHTYSRGNEYLTKIKVCKIINDFVAQGYGCLTLQSSEVEELSPGSHSKIDPMGPKVCVGAGTGLGECYLTPDVNGAYTCFPSEGGHVEWAPRDDLEYKLWTYLKNKFEYQHRVSVERVVSGPGLVNCYEFLVQELKDRIDPTWHAAFTQAEESQQGKLVSDQAHALEGSLGKQALKIMCGAYGSEVGSSGVKFIPTGGLYVTGGLTPKNIKFIRGQNSSFMKAYNDKGRVNKVLETVPLFAVLVEDLGVRGALKSAQIEYEKYIGDVGGSRSNQKRNQYFGMDAVLATQVVSGVVVGVLLGLVLAKRH